MAMLLYYCCGFRKSEVLDLLMQDVDFQTGKICILNGKNDVSRIVVASDTLLLELKGYRDKYLSSAKQEDCFLHRTNGKRYSESTLYNRFHQLLSDAKIPPRKDGGRQRLHDIRHTFCVRALEQMQEKALTCTRPFRFCRVILDINTSQKRSITCGCWKNTLAGYWNSRIPAIRGYFRKRKAVI